MERLFKTFKLMIALAIAVALTFALATANPASAEKWLRSIKLSQPWTVLYVS